MALTARTSRFIVCLLLVVQLLSLTINAAGCSKTNLCKIGCCSKDGFCGTTPEHCGAGCQSTCNYKPPPTECSASKLCATGCCSKAGFCGTTPEHCGNGCQSTCDFKLSCDKDNLCKDGTCCSKFGFCGFGPDYCSKDNCVSGCDAKTFCDPGGYGPEFATHTKCPLNVCCSKWGYCGMTPEFCGNKKVNRPSCSATDNPMRRVVGYYEGWATGRACDKFTPSDIPDGVYTHINFAFASIDPSTFRIIPAAKGDVELYRQLIQKKQIDANLKVFIAIGGWAFNDPGPTVTTFSDIARSEANQRTFISSLVSFMNTYGFDGVDIDWEYPVAPDRQGRGEDLENLPKFLNNIKGALKQNGVSNGLSIAIPASYWYLQHFDIVKIAAHVDFFNVMTYDFHGSWDTPKSWLGNHLNSHTNLTEIEDALDLLWRNQIDPDQVNLGLAFYSRTFTASDPGCMSPGCLFDSGGPKAPCTDAVGVMSNSEIMRHLSGKTSNVELNQAAAVKIVRSGREWLTYDDVDTWKLKLDFARRHCLGGAMVWAISQDTSDGRFSKELQSVTGYKSRAVTTIKTTVSLPGGILKEIYVNERSSDITTKQCRWTNCGEVCPSGWSAVRRSDPYKTNIRDLMLDDTGCDGNGSRTFCCPPGDQPVCQWLFLNAGKCNPGCPFDYMFEVGSTAAGCNNGKAQVACCSGDTPALDVYRQCKWKGKENDCATDLGTKRCSWSSTFSTAIVSSWDGSGSQVCKDSSGHRGQRDYCCDASDTSKAHWNKCAWYDNFALGLTPYADFDQCNGNCPSGKIKVALEKNEFRCKHGTMAYCCDVEGTASAKDMENSLKDALKSWVSSPTCPNTGNKLSSRSADAQYREATPVKREQPQPSATIVRSALQDIVANYPTSKVTKKTRDAWDDAVEAKWKHLSATRLSGMFSPLKNELSSTELLADAILCNMDEWNEELEEETGVSIIHCPLNTLSTVDPSLLENPDDTEVDSESTTIGTNLDLLSSPNAWRWIGIGRRAGGVRTFTVTCPNKHTFSIFSETYPNGDHGDNLAKANGDNKRYYVDNQGGSCYSSGIADDGGRDDDEWVSEHILELQAIRNFIEFSVVGSLASQDKSAYGVKLPAKLNTALQKADCSMWEKEFKTGFDKWWKANHKMTPMKTLYTNLGSIADPSDMVICESKLNSMKARVWGLKDPIARAKWDANCARITKASMENAIKELELLWGVWQYHNSNGVKNKLLAVHMAVADFLKDFENLYREETHFPAMDLEGSHWREYMVYHFERMLELSRGWAESRLGELKRDWTKHLNDLTKRAASGANVANDISIASQALLVWKQRTAMLDEFTFDTDVFLEN